MSQSGMWVRIRVPASTANLGPGFDSLGMALPLFTTIQVRRSARTKVVLQGPVLQGLPENEENLVVQMIGHLFALRNLEPPPVELVMDSQIPLTRGLGSSAAAIIGGLLAGNVLLSDLEKPYSTDELFQIATRLEGHPDNVGASLYGGLVVTIWDGQRAYCQKLVPPASLHVTLVVPSYPLPTERARGALPMQYSKEDAVFNLSHTGFLVAALASGKLQMIRHAMRDRLHQPYRAALVPGMQEILERGPEYGALGCALSGAGPSVLALSDGEQPELARFMRQVFLNKGIDAQVYSFRPWADGAEVEREEVLEGSSR